MEQLNSQMAEDKLMGFYNDCRDACSGHELSGVVGLQQARLVAANCTPGIT
jgi:hypothetical protein